MASKKTTLTRIYNSDLPLLNLSNTRKSADVLRSFIRNHKKQRLVWLFKEILIAIIVGVLTQFILTPIMYALQPAYTTILTPQPFGGIVIFILNNFGFVVFVAIAIYIWKALLSQQQQNIPSYGAG